MGGPGLVLLEMTFMKHWGTILNFVLFAFICLIICIAVWMLSGDIQNWMKLVIYAITFAILFPLIRYIKRIRVKRREVLFLVLMVCALQANAQTEQDDKGILSGNDAALQTMGFVNHLMIDSAKYAIDAMKPNLLPTPTVSTGLSYLNIVHNFLDRPVLCVNPIQSVVVLINQF